jgi:protein O-mannosyl-transferase
VGLKRLCLAVGACAVVVYLGALWNEFALDDNPVVRFNSLVLSTSGMWRAFVSPYWPPELGGGMYRPLPLATYALDWRLGWTTWFHAVNVLWHAGVSIGVAILARRWAGDRGAFAAGLLFAVHPVHVEAVANLVGRSELMAAAFSILAVYAALARDSVGWCAAALAAGLLSKENAAVVPALVGWAWLVGLDRPSRRRMTQYAASWLALGVAYGIVRWAVLRHESTFVNGAPIFIGASPWAVRLTAVAAFADFARLLAVPLHLRVDYSPAERTLVTTPLDGRFALGLLCLATWAGLLWLAWRRGRKVEAFGLGWIALALLPVANLLYPAGVLVAERTLYLPSVGVALAAGAALVMGAGAEGGAEVAATLERRRLAGMVGVGVALLLIAGGVRTALRVPVWRDDRRVVRSELLDSPRSYAGPAHMVVLFLNARQPALALEEFRRAIGIYDRTLPWVYVTGAEAAIAAGLPLTADSLLGRLERVCTDCGHYYRYEAAAALARGNTAAADTFAARVREATRANER